MGETTRAEVIVLGGGPAGLSAAIYLGRAKRDTLVIHSGKSMARWEPDVENYCGFPEGISGTELLRRARVLQSQRVAEESSSKYPGTRSMRSAASRSWLAVR